MEREIIDSGIEWIGAIPHSWHVLPAQRCFVEIKRKNSDGAIQKALKFKFGEIIPKHNFDAEFDDYVAEAITAYTVVEPGTVMINGLNLNYDFKTQRTGLVKETGVITSAYLALWPNCHLILAEYATYLFKGYETRMALHNMGSGIRLTLGFKEFKKQPILLPSLTEQRCIAGFLDHECAEIDRVVAETEKSIEDYKKLKQSVITEAVTKGIRGDRPMKDSGIKWLGKIPEEWECIKLKFVSEFIQDKYNQQYGDLPYIGLENVTSWNGKVVETESQYDREQAMCFISDDILWGKLRPYLAKVYHCVASGCCSGEFCVIRLHKYVSRRYFWNLLISPSFVTEIDQSTYGTKMPRANADYIRNTRVPLPPVFEQQEIADYLDRECTEIDRIIETKQQLLAELNVYKKSLIYEYVTGKTEVPVCQ